MADQLGLYFQLKGGREADLEIMSAAAIAWVESLRAIAKAVQPDSDVRVGIVDADKSSLIYNTVIEWIQKRIEPRVDEVKRGDGRVPHTRSLLLGLVPFVLVTAIPTYDFYFGNGNFTDEDRAMLKQLADASKADVAAETAKRKFYRTVEREPLVTAVGAKTRSQAEPVVLVPVEQFATAGGLWASPEEEIAERVTRPVLEVVLVKPALVHTPRAWTFKPEGLPEFDAVMRDPQVLAAMQPDRGLPERLREGIPMTIRLEVKEVLVDGQWKLVRGGRSVIKVISPKVD